MLEEIWMIAGCKLHWRYVYKDLVMIWVIHEEILSISLIKLRLRLQRFQIYCMFFLLCKISIPSLWFLYFLNAGLLNCSFFIKMWYVACAVFLIKRKVYKVNIWEVYTLFSFHNKRRNLIRDEKNIQEQMD
jgi:hypothetical protein